MSVIPEFLLQTTITRGIKAFRNDHRFIDQLFRNLDQESLQLVRNFIITHTFDLAINYPRETLKVPAVIILLKSETESHAYLSDTMGVELPDEFSFDGGIEGEVIGGAASVSSLSGQGKAVFGPISAISGTANTIKIDSDSYTWYLDQFRNKFIHIVAGLGAGQIRKITTNSTNIAMVSPNWSVIVPDSTTVFEIRDSGDEVLGEPSKLYDRRNIKEFIERRGSIYNVSYQVQIIGDSPESTIFLYAIIKSILTLSRLFLEKHGLLNMRISGSDFQPRTEYMPDFAYMRALNIDFNIPFDVFEHFSDVLDSINLELTANTPITVNVGLDSAHPIIGGLSHLEVA